MFPVPGSKVPLRVSVSPFFTKVLVDSLFASLTWVWKVAAYPTRLFPSFVNLCLSGNHPFWRLEEAHFLGQDTLIIYNKIKAIKNNVIKRDPESSFKTSI